MRGAGAEVVAVVLCALLLYHGSAIGAAAAPCYPAIFVFGDSYSDTGNGNLTGSFFFTRTAQRPYGETFPGYPFTRFSDGRLLVDSLASYLGLPLLNPSLDTSANFSRGVNYAVAGATAEDATYLNNNLVFPLTNLSLDVQLGWHLALKSSNATSSKPDTNAYNNGLYVLEIGINDYVHALQSGYKPSYVNNTFVPLVIDKIRNATQVLFNNGARNFLFFSIPPLGCLPSQLSLFLFDTKDSNNCLENTNSLSYNHGVKLLSLVQGLRAAHPNANFTFVDF